MIGKYQKLAEGLTQNPAMGNILGFLEEIGKAIDDLTPKAISKKESESTIGEDIKPEKRGRKSKK